MNLRKTLLPATAALLAGVLAAYAANTTFFTNRGDIVFPFSPPTRSAPGTVDNMTIGATTPQPGTFTTLTASEVKGALGAYAVDPASNQAYPSYQFSNDQTQMLFTPSGTTTYAYVTLAAAPWDGQTECLFSVGAITTLYVYGSVGQTVKNAASTLAANGRLCYLYSLSNTTWNRSQ